MKNYDLNIWDALSYNTDGEETGGWKVNAYEIPLDNGGYGSGPILDQELRLSEANVRALDLDPFDDDELWIDARSLLREYKNVPRRVRRFIESLPGWEG